MFREIKKHKWAYLVLAVNVVLFTILFFAAWPNRVLQRFLIVFLFLFYITWGSITHVKTEELTRRVFWEYVAVGGLASLLLFLVTI